mmetsp:Transcript_16227/g.41634  ORF Transcript_16227/g.41634 Transcript_16227/m.41634 type:complete len:209 (+) Transcript_16227:136-762(+)
MAGAHKIRRLWLHFQQHALAPGGVPLCAGRLGGGRCGARQRAEVGALPEGGVVGWGDDIQEDTVGQGGHGVQAAARQGGEQLGAGGGAKGLTGRNTHARVLCLLWALQRLAVKDGRRQPGLFLLPQHAEVVCVFKVVRRDLHLAVQHPARHPHAGVVVQGQGCVGRKKESRDGDSVAVVEVHAGGGEVGLGFAGRAFLVQPRKARVSV